METDEAYPNLASDGSISKQDDDENDEYLQNTKRDDTVKDGRKISQMCGTKDSDSDYETCMKTLSAHTVWVNTKNNKVYGKTEFGTFNDIKRMTFTNIHLTYIIKILMGKDFQFIL